MEACLVARKLRLTIVVWCILLVLWAGLGLVLVCLDFCLPTIVNRAGEATNRRPIEAQATHEPLQKAQLFRDIGLNT